MIKTLTRTGNSLALVIDKALVEPDGHLAVGVGARRRRRAVATEADVDAAAPRGW